MPPSNIEAEESVLGAMMLSADAGNSVMDRLEPGDFYKPAHQLIFEVVQGLFDSNEPIDAVTVSEGLRRDGSLDRMGGIGFLTGLIDAVPSTSNVDYYASIVEEHALRRRLMRVGADISLLAGKTADAIDEVVDRAEQAVYAVSDKRHGDGLQVSTTCSAPRSKRPRSCTAAGQR